MGMSWFESVHTTRTCPQMDGPRHFCLSKRCQDSKRGETKEDRKREKGRRHENLWRRMMRERSIMTLYRKQIRRPRAVAAASRCVRRTPCDVD